MKRELTQRERFYYLKEKGVTYEQIGKMHDCTKQNVYNVLQYKPRYQIAYLELDFFLWLRDIKRTDLQETLGMNRQVLKHKLEFKELTEKEKDKIMEVYFPDLKKEDLFGK